MQHVPGALLQLHVALMLRQVYNNPIAQYSESLPQQLPAHAHRYLARLGRTATGHAIWKHLFQVQTRACSTVSLVHGLLNLVSILNFRLRSYHSWMPCGRFLGLCLTSLCRTNVDMGTHHVNKDHTHQSSYVHGCPDEVTPVQLSCHQNVHGRAFWVLSLSQLCAVQMHADIGIQ